MYVHVYTYHSVTAHCRVSLTLPLPLLLPQSVGQLGEVLKKVPPSGLVVRVCGRRWILDTRCLVPTPDATLPNNAGPCPCMYIHVYMYIAKTFVYSICMYM